MVNFFFLHSLLTKISENFHVCSRRSFLQGRAPFCGFLLGALLLTRVTVAFSLSPYIQKDIWAKHSGKNSVEKSQHPKRHLRKHSGEKSKNCNQFSRLLFLFLPESQWPSASLHISKKAFGETRGRKHNGVNTVEKTQWRKHSGKNTLEKVKELQPMFASSSSS